ncbi:phage holin family protein [Arsenicicoccus sp. oral taxon 190]|uniref:phage holin family protein n=1 Tax=Arsenicicoccus sp. oral taxon 190 TaxID=1658671 RepID=UPI0009E33126|nr:phage holin family protein [Arsenicicoccus sp. oral taxon 190]
MSTSYNEQEHEARRAYRDREARSYGHDTSARTIGQLVADATQDVSSILRNEIQLAKSEVKTDVAKAGKGIGMFAGAGVLAFLALILLLIALAYGLIALGLAPWLAFLIVAVLLLVVAGILAMIGKGALAKAKFKPERTIRNAQETVEALKPSIPGAASSASTTSPSASSYGSASYTSHSTTAHSTTDTGRVAGETQGAHRVDADSVTRTDTDATSTRV